MPLTVLLSACALALLYLAARRAVVRPASPGDGTAPHAPDWLAGSPVAERLGDARPVAAPDGWQSLTVSDLTVAEELLDRLEVAGIVERELVVLGNSTFVVRWRQKP